MRSIVKPGKLDEIQCIIETFQKTIHVIVFVETWIKDDNEAQRLKLPNYTHYYNFRKTTRGGGVSIYVHNTLTHECIDELSDDGDHYLWVHVDKLSLDIGAIYRQPTANVNKFLENFDNQTAGRKRAVVFGDFNLNLLNEDNSVKEYKFLLQGNGFRILNKVDMKYCTRQTQNSRTLLDHVCTNLRDNTYHMAIIDSAMSDHKQIYFEVDKIQPEKPKRIEFKAVNYDDLYKTVEDKIDYLTNLFVEYERLENLLLEAVAKNITLRSKRQNPPKTGWINKNLISSINKRNILWHDLKQNPVDEKLKQDFLLQRNSVQIEIQSSKKQYYMNAFKNCKKNPLKMWKLINNLANNKTENN